jgi:hypothetical protein
MVDNLGGRSSTWQHRRRIVSTRYDDSGGGQRLVVDQIVDHTAETRSGGADAVINLRCIGTFGSGAKRS